MSILGKVVWSNSPDRSGVWFDDIDTIKELQKVIEMRSSTLIKLAAETLYQRQNECIAPVIDEV